MKSDEIVADVIKALDACDYARLESLVHELCRYHIEMRDHALRLERVVHALMKDVDD